MSFQGESFFYQTSRAKAAGSPKPTPERRRLSTAAAAAAGAASSKAGEQSENSRPSDRHHRWPAAKPQASNPLARSLDYSLESKNSILATVHLLQQSMVFDDGLRRASSFDADDLSASSDTDSVSSGSNSGAQDLGVSGRARVSQRGISVPARFWPETSGRLGLVKRSSVDSPFSSPRSASSPLRGPVRASSPCKVMASPSRGMASPLRGRSGSAVSTSSPVGVQPANAPSIISFAVEVRRAKKGENRIEEAHVLRLLDNRHLQWRFVNARIDALLLVQRLTAEVRAITLQLYQFQLNLCFAYHFGTAYLCFHLCSL